MASFAFFPASHHEGMGECGIKMIAQCYPEQSKYQGHTCVEVFHDTKKGKYTISVVIDDSAVIEHSAPCLLSALQYANECALHMQGMLRGCKK